MGICDLIRCCFESPQISLNQLSVFLDMAKTQKTKQHRLTFEDIQSWNNQKLDNQNSVVLVGPASFINEWSLFDQNKDAKKRELDNDKNEKENEQIIQKQKGCQTQIVQTKDSCMNTDECTLNITDCINILPFNDAEESKMDHHNLLIIEFSKFCNIEMPQSNEQNKLFSFQCQMNGTDKLSASPIFKIDDLIRSKKEKIYIHIMCDSILETLDIQLIAHKKLKEEIGEISIDLSMLRESKHIEGYFHISGKHKLGKVYIRILPQFNISDSVNSVISPSESCNQSVVTDDQSIASTEAWKMFNTF